LVYVILPVPDGPYDAYLFDCDGTITDSMPLHYVAWQGAFAEYGAVFTEDRFYEWGGRPAADIIADLNAEQGLAMPVDAVTERHGRLFLDTLPQVTVIPGVLEHIHEAYGRLPFAVVSGSTREIVAGSLDALGILDLFEVLVCAGDYVNPKPDPECFLVAAAKLGVEPARCLVFEDSDLGIRGALDAGMAAVKVPSPGR
jgi:beta-phosphoglucomutase-like phosphatase (HAD superfamily)